MDLMGFIRRNPQKFEVVSLETSSPGASFLASALSGTSPKYHRSANGRKCASKVDLRKAYDSVSWHSKLQTLDGTRFPEKFISWVKACITSPSFLINGNDNELKEYFPSAKGLKQGYPCHPT
ncbi:unnamed protein product [Camellia sinensis]